MFLDQLKPDVNSYNMTKSWLSIFLIMSIAINITLGMYIESKKQQEFREARELYHDLNQYILNLGIEMDDHMDQLVDEIYLGLESNFSRILKVNFASCYHGFINRFVEDMKNLLKPTPSTPCYRLVKEIWDDIEDHIRWSATDILPLYRSLNNCGRLFDDCNYESSYQKIMIEILNLKYVAERYREEIYEGKRNMLDECYKRFGDSFEKKINLLSVPPDKCPLMNNYMDFLRALSLNTLTYDKFDKIARNSDYMQSNLLM